MTVWDVLNQDEVRTVLSAAFVLAVIYAGWIVAQRLAPTTSKADTNDVDFEKSFEEMRFDGDIDAEELRKIKSVIGKTQQLRPGE